MSRLLAEMRRRMIPGRIVLLTMILLGVAFGLLLFVVSTCDSDQPQTAAEHFCRTALAVICWPVMAARSTGLDSNLSGLAFGVLGIVFWAAFIEFLVTLRHARQTQP